MSLFGKNIFNAAKSGDIKSLKKYLKKGADLNQKNQESLTLLHIASKNNQTETIKFLLENNADINAVQGAGWTALHFAAGMGYIESVKILLEYGANVNIQENNFLATPLYFAIKNAMPGYGENKNIVKLLLDNGAEINKLDNVGRSVLHIAIKNDDKDIIKLLERSGGKNLYPDSKFYF